MGNNKEYVCQSWHEFMDGDGFWVYEKTVESKEDAEAWASEFPEDRRFYETRISSLKVMQNQLECIENGTQSDLPKDIVIDAYKDVIKCLEKDWRLVIHSKDGHASNIPETHKPLVLLTRTDSGKFMFKTQIYDDWTKDLFKYSNTIAWKYIELPSWISDVDFGMAYPKYEVTHGGDPSCSID